MSKLDTLANKIAEKMMPKMRRMVREELDYKLDKLTGGKQVMHDKSSGQSKTKGSPETQNVNEQARGGDFSKVAEGMGIKQKFKNINGDTVVDPHETFEDENGKVHKMGELMQDPDAQKVMESVNKDYSNLID